MIQLNQIQLTSQTPNHVEITKIFKHGVALLYPLKIENL